MSESTQVQDIILTKEDTLLIVGKAATPYGIRDVKYETDSNEVLKKYGDSDLSRAFDTAKSLNVEHIFLMNVQNIDDWIDSIEIIKQNDFSYVVPVSMILTDTFSQPYDGGEIHSCFAHILGLIGKDSDSVFIITDKHASLYENIDSFIDYMNDSVKEFESCLSFIANKENIIIVANNLADYPMANLVLAAAMCNTPANKYPTGDFGNAIFHIDYSDDVYDFAYFKGHSARETTIEYLVNCLDGIQTMKVVFISRLAKYIKRQLDFTEFKGTFYRPYQKLRIQAKLEKYLNALTGFVINKYEIESVTAYKGVPGTVTIVCRFTIWPIGSFEKITLDKEVTIG